MGAIVAKKNLNQYRCAMPDCGKLLATGSFSGTIQIRCKCGCDNILKGEFVTTDHLKISEKGAVGNTGKK